MTARAGDEGQARSLPAQRPLERAQLVWQRAITLSGPGQSRDRFTVVLDLLRTARHGPSTMLHALALGEAQQRASPEDIPTRNAVRLLSRAVTWLGRRTEDDEVGNAGGRGPAPGAHPGPA